MRKNNGFAVASLICGILGWFMFSIALAPLAIIFGVKGLKAESDYFGLGVAGLVCGIIESALIALGLLAAVAVL